MTEPLKPGDTFPIFTASTVQGGPITIPTDLTTRYTAVLFYRASW